MELDGDLLGAGGTLPPDPHAVLGQRFWNLLQLGAVCLVLLAAVAAHRLARHYMTPAKRVQAILAGNAAALAEERAAGRRKKQL